MASSLQPHRPPRGRRCRSFKLLRFPAARLNLSTAAIVVVDWSVQLAKDEKFSLPGYGLIDPDTLSDSELESWTEEEWRAEFIRTRDSLATFLRVRDPFAVLAKTSMRHMLEARIERSAEAKEELPAIEQGDVELVQALLLAQSEPQHYSPTSPGNFVRFWHMLSCHILSFTRKHPEKHSDKPIVDLIRVCTHIGS
jgi:hypothetical protein